MEVMINWWAILGAMASAMVVGAIWYDHKTPTGKAWFKLTKISKKQEKENGPKALTIMLFKVFFTAFGLYHFVYVSSAFFDISWLSNSLQTALWGGVTFSWFNLVMHDGFESRPIKLTSINLGHDFLSIMAMGLAIGLIGN